MIDWRAASRRQALLTEQLACGKLQSLRFSWRGMQMLANHYSDAKHAPDAGTLPVQGGCSCPGAAYGQRSGTPPGGAGRLSVWAAVLVFLVPVVVMVAGAWLLAGNPLAQAVVAAAASGLIVVLVVVFRKGRSGEPTPEQPLDPRCPFSASRSGAAQGDGR